MNNTFFIFLYLQSSQSFWEDMKAGEEAIRSRIVREAVEQATFVRTIKSSTGEPSYLNVSIVIGLKYEVK
jgi:hypothetical protein